MLRILTDSDRERVRLLTVRTTDRVHYPTPTHGFDGKPVSTLMLEAARKATSDFFMQEDGNG